MNVDKDVRILWIIIKRGGDERFLELTILFFEVNWGTAKESKIDKN